MAYEDKFNQELRLDILNEGQEFIVRMFMKNGELLFRERLIKQLEEEVSTHLNEAGDEANVEWVDGVNYVIHLIREADFDG
jgi:hypothetical protein